MKQITKNQILYLWDHQVVVFDQFLQKLSLFGKKVVKKLQKQKKVIIVGLPLFDEFEIKYLPQFT